MTDELKTPYTLYRTHQTVCPDCGQQNIDLLFGDGLANFFICRTPLCRFVGHVGVQRVPIDDPIDSEPEKKVMPT